MEDLLAIPEEHRRHELIEGVIEPKGAASGRHGATQRKLSAYIDPFDRRPGGRPPGGWWFATEVDVYFDPLNTFRDHHARSRAVIRVARANTPGVSGDA